MDPELQRPLLKRRGQATGHEGTLQGQSQADLVSRLVADYSLQPPPRCLQCLETSGYLLQIALAILRVLAPIVMWFFTALYYLYKVIPKQELLVIYGCALCFFGGEFCASIAAVECFRRTGGDKLLLCLQESQLNLDATGQDLVFLRQQLSKDAGLDDETGIPDDKVEDLSHEVPIPSDLTERVARLPNHWRRALMDLLEEAEALQEKMTCDTCDEDLLHTPVDEGNEALTEDVLGIDEPDEIGEICEVDRKLDPDSEKEDEQLEADSEPIRSTSSGGNPAPSKSQCSVPSQEPVGCSQGSQGSQDRQAEVSAETPDGEDVTATSRARESPATVGKDLVAAGGGAAAVRVVRAAEKDLPD